ncbi:hypothetical protein A8C32_06230 [Flavivirga aquatica]|uniref:HTH tetR-type domain-containing protein n=1 Tax=Flavivirga aquatica TaxID=1849968 RepID=A0A1E5SI51_9FLAO|nr:TetR/AcrR family transcriptional regulator [Flavivirga aquatica]OEJ98791.1 hypothetical protein A8C32_06230 [Flavivirga aquatica]
MIQRIKSEETQRLILVNAFTLFYKNGYRSTSIPDIVKHAGLSKGAFYHHFKSKEDLGKQTINHILRNRIYNGIIGPIKNHDSKPVITFLIDLFTNRIANFSETESRLGCPLNNLINELGCAEETFRINLRKIIEEWKTALIDLLEYGKEKGEIKKNINTTVTAMYIISAFEGARGIGKLYNDKEILQQYLFGFIAYVKQLE